MKTGYRTILIMAMAAVVLSTTALYCRAAEQVTKEQDNIWSEDTAKERFELTEEKIERIMNQLADTNPEKAEELKQLKEKDPEEFKVELRKVMREQFGKRFRKRMEKRAEQHIKRFGEPFGPNDMPPETGMRRYGKPFGPGHVLPEMGMRWKYDKYLDWLKENYAEEAEKLAELNEKDPGLYWKQFGLSLKKYGRIAEAARENTQLAEVLKKDLVLKQQQWKLLEQIKTAGDKEKEELLKELKEVLTNKFDVIVERKQIEYEQLLEKLERLKSEVEQRKAKMEKWKDAKFKDESVKARLEELLSKADEFKW